MHSSGIIQKHFSICIYVSIFLSCCSQQERCKMDSLPYLELNQSIQEIALNHVKLKDVNSFADESIILLENTLLSHGFENEMKIMLDLFRHHHLKEVKILSPDLVFYLFCRSDGFLRWKKGYVVYNRHKVSLIDYVTENEEILKYDKSNMSHWYRLTSRQHLD